MKFNRFLSVDILSDQHVSELVEWQTVSVTTSQYSSDAAEAPATWSQNAINILASKYFRKAGVPAETRHRVGIPGTQAEVLTLPEFLWPSTNIAPDGLRGGETSAKQVFHRLAGCWTYWGWREGVFGGDEESAQIFYDETYLCLARQIALPNSPQWFNTGLWWAYGIEGDDSGMWYYGPDGPQRIFNSYERPQSHACFLTPVQDHLVTEGGIMDAWLREAKIFKHGSGSGINASVWRAKGERLSGGGRASGVMSWLSIGDKAAGAIQSGGTTRRAAKMVLLNDDHPELTEFINWKVSEEYKAAAMYVGSQLLRNYYLDIGDPSADPNIDVPLQMIERMKLGFEPRILGKGFEEEANQTIDGQNSNNSIFVSDEFLSAVQKNEPWHLTARTTGDSLKTVPAGDLWRDLIRAAWACGDPGVLYRDTINAWNTCSADGEIKTTNPCFTGDTKVWTIYGPKRFDELAASGEAIPVLTELSDGKLAYRMMTGPRKTRSGTKLVRVMLKAKRGIRGHRVSITKVKVTPDHVFYLSSGGEKKASDLRPGDRLESAYRRAANQKGYIGLRATNGDVVMEHHLVAEFDHGRRPVWPAEHGHHVDEIKDRNVPGNVEIVSSSKHNSEHMLGDRNPMRRWFGTLSEEDKQIHRDKMSVAVSGDRNPNYGNKGHLAGWKWINNGVRCRRLPRDEEIPRGWHLGYLRRNNFVSEETKRKRSETATAMWARRRESTNHTVVSVRPLADQEDVYCGTVADTGRFFISPGDVGDEGVLVSNCSEFLHLDGSACLLASLKLTAFKRADGSFDTDLFEHVCRLFTVVLDISVSMASFPAKEFAVGAHDYRTLGLGYMDLGGLLMRLAIPYDSDEARGLAAAITALMTGVSYATSSELAAELGPFPRWEANKNDMQRVVRNHALSAMGGSAKFEGLNVEPYLVVCPDNYDYIQRRVDKVWRVVLAAESFRNAQTTLIAPTGTISLAADCDTSGVEPDFALKKFKSLAGGGSMDIVNQAVPEALRRLGYLTADVALICDYVSATGLVPMSEDAAARWGTPVNGNPSLHWVKDEHLAVFDCANPLFDGGRFIRPLAHVEMVAAVQPFVSGGVSKTTNLPNDATVEDVSNIYTTAHSMGLKSIALYRDGSKLAQPVQRTKSAQVPLTEFKPQSMVPGLMKRGERERLSARRKGITQKIRISGQTAYYRTGEYPDGRLAEVFIDLANVGSTLNGFANCLAKMISIALQFGVPVSEVVDALLGLKFEPGGFVELHDRIKQAQSLPDLIARDIAITYLGRDDLANVLHAVAVDDPEKIVAMPDRFFIGETCRIADCGGLLVQTGNCKTCTQCGWNEGCG